MDFETRSAVDLKKAGAERYCEDLSTEVIGLTYWASNGKKKRWEKGDPDPVDLLEGLARGDKIKAHNSRFERLVTNVVIPRMGLNWPKISIEQCDCTMVRAMALALPADLDSLGRVLRLKEKKDHEGHTLMKKVTKPRKPRKGEDPNVLHWYDDEVTLARLADYRDQDVVTEIEADSTLRPLLDVERAYWHLDQRMNDRGIQLDLKNARKLMAIAKIVVAQADARITVLTRGAVTACTQAAAIAKWVETHGIHCESVAKDEIEDVLKDARWCGFDDVVEVLELRKELSKASTAKIKTMFLCVCADGRARGQVQFIGASITGRDCIAEGTPVLINRAGAVLEVPIETVRVDDLVWDGDQWVRHEGVEFSGVKEILTYEGLSATELHHVYISDTEKVTLGEAIKKGLRLFTGKTPPLCESTQSKARPKKSILGLLRGLLERAGSVMHTRVDSRG